MENSLLVTSSPHWHGDVTTRSVMLDVLIALLPAAAASVWLFGWRALMLEIICIGACTAAEYLSRVVMKRPQTAGDFSCMVTGLLLAFNLPVTIPIWEAVLGCVVAIVVAKQLFGGLGQNFVNPALAGRIVLLESFPADMNNWISPLDGRTTATPLADPDLHKTVWQLLLGERGGCIGETCVVALLIGFAYLLMRRIISPVIPVCFVGTVFVLTWLLGANPVNQILSGGLMLGAIFMATDYVTSPITTAGKVIFGVGCGGLTVLIRLYGSLPEGVSFAIVIMNILVPLIERITRPRPFGAKGGKAHA